MRFSIQYKRIILHAGNSNSLVHVRDSGPHGQVEYPDEVHDQTSIVLLKGLIEERSSEERWHCCIVAIPSS